MTEVEGHRHSDETGSELVFDFYCEFCREDGKMLEAEGYCVDCGEYLCDTCYTHHRRSRPYRHHVLMDKDKMPKDSPLSHDKVNKGISKICNYHSGKPVEYYCKEHDILGCYNCIIKSHRNCNTVENIPEVAESIMESQEFKSFIDMLNQFDQRARRNIEMVQDNLNKSRSWCSEVTNSVQKFREEINSILDELEKAILIQAENLQKDEDKTLTKVSDQFATSLQSVEKLAEEFDNLQTSRNVCEIYIKLQQTMSEVKTIKVTLDEAEKENVISEYVFDPNTKLKELMNSQERFGKLSVQASSTSPVTTVAHCNGVDTKAIHVTDIDVKYGMEGSRFNLTGSVVLSKNKLIISDHSNCKVKLIDTQSNKVISELKVSNNPWDVTVISRNQAAVTLYDRKILLLSVSDTLTLDREITVFGTCRGVAYIKNRLVVTYWNPGKLEIMDLFGKVMKTVENDSDGNKLFACPQYVCISKDEETIYVSDFSSKKVTSLTFDGVVKSVYSDSRLNSPEKVCVDHHGNVYVCGYSSVNVHMLTADLTKIQIILTQADGLVRGVYSVSHCQETNRLYVGMSSNMVKVYQLSQ